MSHHKRETIEYGDEIAEAGPLSVFLLLDPLEVEFEWANRNYYAGVAYLDPEAFFKFEAEVKKLGDEIRARSRS